MKIIEFHSIVEDIRYLNAKNVTSKTEYPKTPASAYNCWGFTAALFEDVNYSWMDMHEMGDWLDRNTVPVNTPQIGDIGVFRGIDPDENCCDCECHYTANPFQNYCDHCEAEIELLHTAVLLDPDNQIFLHKPGWLPLERASLDFILTERWYYGNLIEYRRLKK